IIRNDTVLPAAGFDDCEHRFIPSCSIPASDNSLQGLSGSAFWSVVMGTIFAPVGGEPRKIAQKQAARESPRRMGGLIAAESRESRQTGLKTGQK
ncbi:hypothetical protein, partial [Acinetobacter baumannii]|uniref:hypothetical protein n=1 Tax=Acinetobacter baumannii TaxID=470 RepID=UPI001BB46463